ncbi:enolase [Scheffersomyces coipomensis]|uniref:enolase n=1 Tax=Scheffersomyces coipomensis TaxID=1788519 RepID=UPI00315C54C6
MTISKVYARVVYDSRGNPTVEVVISTEKGKFSAIVPSGAHHNSHECLDLRDNDPKKWNGRGVSQAVQNVNEIIAPALIKANLDVTDQESIDEFLIDLDGTPTKEKLGANAILAVSLAVAKAGAGKKGSPLYKHIADLAKLHEYPFLIPTPFFNVLNGGIHSGSGLTFQEFMVVPYGAPSFFEAVRYATEIFHTLRTLTIEKYGSSSANLGDEGGIAPNVENARQALDLIVSAIKGAGYEGQVGIAIDASASDFYKEGKYDLNFKNEELSNAIDYLTSDQLAELYWDLINKYPIVSLEDPFSEDDWEAWTKYYPKFQSKVQIVADAITSTTPEIIEQGIEKKIANVLLLKLNQIGTLTEAIDAAKLAYDAGWAVQVSHRSGETEDTTIADLAVGLRTAQIKSGAPARSERFAKYNQIIRIEDDLEKYAVYAGKNFHDSNKS